MGIRQDIQRVSEQKEKQDKKTKSLAFEKFKSIVAARENVDTNPIVTEEQRLKSLSPIERRRELVTTAVDKYKSNCMDVDDFIKLYDKIESIRKNERILPESKVTLVKNLLILNVGYSGSIVRLNLDIYFVYYEFLDKLNTPRNSFLFIGTDNDLLKLKVWLLCSSFCSDTKCNEYDKDSREYRAYSRVHSSIIPCIVIDDSLNITVLNYDVEKNRESESKELSCQDLYSFNAITMQNDSKYINENSAELKHRLVYPAVVRGDLSYFIQSYYKGLAVIHTKDTILRLLEVLGYSTLGVYEDDCYLIRGKSLYDTVLIVYDKSNFFKGYTYSAVLSTFATRTIRLSCMRLVVFCKDAVIWCKYRKVVPLVHWKYMEETLIAHNLEFLSRDRIFKGRDNPGILCNVTN